MVRRVGFILCAAVLLCLVQAWALALELPEGNMAVQLTAGTPLSLSCTAEQAGLWVMRIQSDKPVSLDDETDGMELYAQRQLSEGETWTVTVTAEQDTMVSISVAVLRWQVDGDALTVEASGPMPDLTGHETPWRQQADGIRTLTVLPGVTAIPAGAFSDLRGLTDVTLPFVGACNGSDQPLTYIFGDLPFSLRRVTITAPCTMIPENGFRYCSQLTHVSLPVGVRSIGKRAFEGCIALQQAALPEGLQVMGDSCFYNCDALTVLVIPDTVTTLGDAAFRGCDLLESVTLPAGSAAIGKETFRGCTSLKRITIPTGVTEIGSNAFYGCAALTEVTLPDSLQTIGDSCFRNCGQLKDITLPAGLLSLGRYAFSSCASLTAMQLPSGITALGTEVFSGCTLLTQVAMPGVTSIGSGAFADSGLGRLDLPLGCTAVAAEAFKGTNVVLAGYPGSMAQVCAEREGLPFETVDISMPIEEVSWQLFMQDQTQTASLTLLLPEREQAALARVQVYAGNTLLRPEETIGLQQTDIGLTAVLRRLPVETELRIAVQLVIPWRDDRGVSRESVVGEGTLACVCRVPMDGVAEKDITVTVLGRTTAEVRWNPVAGADLYEVHCRPLGDDGAATMILADLTDPACTLRGLTPLTPCALYVYPRRLYEDGSMSQLPQQADCVSFTPRLMDFELAAAGEAVRLAPMPLVLTAEGAESPDAWQEAVVTVTSAGEWQFSGGMLLMTDETDYLVTVTSASCTRSLTLHPVSVPVLTLPSGLKRMDEGALSGVPAGVLMMPNGMRELSPEALSGCGSLLAIYLPESLILGDEDPFIHCMSAVLVTAAPAQADWARARGHRVMCIAP